VQLPCAVQVPSSFIKHNSVPEAGISVVQLAHSFSQSSHPGFIHSFIPSLLADSFNSKYIMRITALTLLALGASTSAYVVPNDKKVADNGVEARMPVSYYHVPLV
jgi:hypothetical protein